MKTSEFDIRDFRQGRNLLMNGGFLHDQRILSGLGTGRFPRVFNSSFTSGYTLDRWLIATQGLSTGVMTVSQASTSPNFLTSNSLRIDVNTAEAAIGAAEAAVIEQKIEGRVVRVLDGIGFVYAIQVRSNKTGVLPVSFRNSGADRSYVAELSITGDGLWHQYSIFVPAPPFSAGTWNFTNGTGMRVVLTLAAGSTLQTTAGAWTTGNFIGTSGGSNWLDNSGTYIEIAQAQLTPGSDLMTWAPFGGDFLADMMACFRYFLAFTETQGLAGTGPILWALDTNSLTGWLPTPVPMRGNPAVRTDVSQSWSFVNVTTGTPLSVTVDNANQASATITENIPGVNMRIENNATTFNANQYYATPDLNNRRFALDAEL